jgi:hypothetical protein
MKLLPIVVLIGVLFPPAIFAGTPGDSSAPEKRKSKIVSRLYQATYGSAERCKKAPPDVAAEFQSELTRFVETNGHLMKLVVRSPYYEPARQKFSRHEAIDPARDTPEKLARECQHLAQLLRSMSDTPEGKKAVKEYEGALSK